MLPAASFTRLWVDHRMSIIERALGKLQDSQATPPAAQGARPSARLPRHGRPSAPARERIHRDVIEADLDYLRAEGMLPPTEFADVLTDQFRRIKWPILESAVGRSSGESRSNNLVM